jgi:hypothetical protein
MGKRRPFAPRGQMAFDFVSPAPPADAGGLANLSRWMASSCGAMLSEDRRQREDIAARLSEMLEEPVSKAMLDAYASEARDGHNVSAARWLGLIVITGRYDLLDAALVKIGARALQGDEMATARLGHLYALRAELDDEIKAVRPLAKPLERALRGGRR